MVVVVRLNNAMREKKGINGEIVSRQTGFCMTCNFSHYLFFKRGKINVLCFEQTSDCNSYDNKLATFKDWFNLATLTRHKLMALLLSADWST